MKQDEHDNENKFFSYKEVTICYKTYGDSNNPAIFLIMGVNAAGTYWAPDFCNAIAEHGYYVIAPDNRDTGLSTSYKSKDQHIPFSFLKSLVGIKIQSEYNLYDIAEDYIALMKYLLIQKAHFLGVSMGGMIAQVIAGKYPQKVLSLSLMNTTTGNYLDIIPTQKYRQGLSHIKKQVSHIKDPIEQASKRDEILIHFLDNQEQKRDREETHSFTRFNNQRSNIEGAGKRHSLAIIASLPFQQWTQKITAPTLILHGEKEFVFSKKKAYKIHDQIANSTLIFVENMGHAVMPSLYDMLTQHIVQHITLHS